MMVTCAHEGFTLSVETCKSKSQWGVSLTGQNDHHRLQITHAGEHAKWWILLHSLVGMVNYGPKISHHMAQLGYSGHVSRKDKKFMSFSIMSNSWAPDCSPPLLQVKNGGSHLLLQDLLTPGIELHVFYYWRLKKKTAIWKRYIAR